MSAAEIHNFDVYAVCPLQGVVGIYAVQAEDRAGSIRKAKEIAANDVRMVRALEVLPAKPTRAGRRRARA